MPLRRGVVAVGLLILAGSAPSPVAAQPQPPASREVFETVVELIRSGDADLLPVALEKVRSGLKGEAFTRELAEEVLPSLNKPQDKATLLAALADRADKAALPAIMAIAEGPADATVRAAAIRGVAALGGADEVPFLIGLLSSDATTSKAASGALVAIRAADVSAPLRAALADQDRPGPERLALVGILAERRESSALEGLLTAAIDENAEIRAAAIKALGTLGGPEQVPGMIDGVLAAQSGAERIGAERALVGVCTQHREKEKAAAALLERFEAADPAVQEALLPTLARVGGPAVLRIVERLIASPASRERAMGLAALARWPDASVKDQLLELIRTASDGAERELLLGGLIRIAPLPDNTLDPAEKLALVEQAMELCTRDEDRRRLLERSSAIRTVETLRYLLPFLDQPALAESACLSVVELAHHRTLRDGHKDEFIKALDRVLATTTNAEVIDRAGRYKLGKTWERKKAQ